MSLRPLWIAARLLSRLPVPDPSPVTPAETGRSVPWYPFIGLLIGLLVGLCASAMAWLDAPAAVAAVLTLAVWVWASGGLHLDGLADSADAWVGGLGSRERTLAIMKDPCSGPAAVTLLVLVLIGKWACLQALLAPPAPPLAPVALTSVPALLIAIALLGRTQLPLLLLTTPYARPAGMAADQSRALARRASTAAVLATGVGTLLLTGAPGLALLLTTLVLFLAGRRAMLGRLAGFTGDTAGALVELTETALLLVAVLLLR